MNRFSRLTSNAPAAIAVIAIEGKDAEAWLDKHWTPHAASRRLALNHIRYGQLEIDSPSACREVADEIVGESIVVCRTGPNQFELHCHGGHAASGKVMAKLVSDGFQYVSGYEWIAARDSLTAIQRQAMEDLAHSYSLRTTSILLDQYRGALDTALQDIRISLRTLLEQSNASIAESSQDTKELLQSIQQQIDRLLAWKEVGLHLVHPWKVVLIGPPNSGKSSLLNVLLGYERAIVHETAGTTRDLLVEQTSMAGWPVQLLDSAGVRATDDPIEQAGIEAAMRAVAQADLVLMLIPSDTGWTAGHADLYRELMACRPTVRLLLVHTKTDLQAKETVIPESLESIVQSGHRSIAISVFNSPTIQQLMHAIVESLVVTLPDSGAAVPFRTEHFEWLRECKNALAARQWNDAIHACSRCAAESIVQE